MRLLSSICEPTEAAASPLEQQQPWLDLQAVDVNKKFIKYIFVQVDEFQFTEETSI